eukprot:18888-Heterococcus_DN1.PRE.5
MRRCDFGNVLHNVLPREYKHRVKPGDALHTPSLVEAATRLCTASLGIIAGTLSHVCSILITRPLSTAPCTCNVWHCLQALLATLCHFFVQCKANCSQLEVHAKHEAAVRAAVAQLR